MSFLGVISGRSVFPLLHFSFPGTIPCACPLHPALCPWRPAFLHRLPLRAALIPGRSKPRQPASPSAKWREKRGFGSSCGAQILAGHYTPLRFASCAHCDRLPFLSQPDLEPVLKFKNFRIGCARYCASAFSIRHAGTLRRRHAYVKSRIHRRQIAEAGPPDVIVTLFQPQEKAMKKLLTAALLAPLTAFAHGIWISPHYGEMGIVYGMGYADDAYAPQKVRFVKGYTANFKPASVEIKAHEKHSTVQAAADAAVLTAFFDNGYWEKDPNGKWKEVEKSAISKPADTSTSLKYNITLLKPYQGRMQPFDLPVQIIPGIDPSTLKQGESLPVTVYVEGKPQAGIEITADYINDFANRVKTDEKGQAVLTVRNAGHNVVAALINHPTPQNEHAHLQRNVATLSFKSAK
nr:DUF4198 domain-containing protein [uncultured Ottowia sp.]